MIPMKLPRTETSWINIATQVLTWIKRLDCAIERRLDDIELAQQKINRVTSTLNKINIQGGQPAPLAESIDRLIEAQQAANEAINCFIDAKAIVTDYIDRLNDPDLANLLHARYIAFKSWDATASEMHFSVKYLTGELHRKALIALGQVLEEEPPEGMTLHINS